MLEECTASQPVVIRAIVPDHSPCFGGWPLSPVRRAGAPSRAGRAAGARRPARPASLRTHPAPPPPAGPASPWGPRNTPDGATVSTRKAGLHVVRLTITAAARALAGLDEAWRHGRAGRAEGGGSHREASFVSPECQYFCSGGGAGSPVPDLRTASGSTAQHNTTQPNTTRSGHARKGK